MTNQPEAALRRVEVLAALSLATDLGMALPFEHGLRATLIAVRLADALGLDRADRTRTFELCLLYYLGCTADAADVAGLFGDEVAMHRRIAPVAFGTPGQIARASLPLLGSGRSPARRLAMYARMPVVMGVMREGAQAHCEVGEMLGEPLGVDAVTRADFRYMYESWRGRGFPGRANGEQIPLPVRIAQVARDADVQHGLGGVAQATRVIGARAGAAFDPAVAAAFTSQAPQLLDGIDTAPAWDEVLAADPTPDAVLTGPAADEALAAVADFVDLKNPFARHHSRSVAALAAGAGARLGLDPTWLRWAGYAHDLGRVAVSAAVWGKPGPLGSAQWEEVRLHAYWTERILVRLSLPGFAACAAAHHERQDASGYPRAIGGADLPPTARVLAAADVYAALIQDRPYRPRYTPDAAATVLRDEAKAGGLDPTAVGAVLAEAGHARPRVDRPAALTDREVEVLALLSAGLATKQVAARLTISPKTADRHIQNLYAKIGVSTRAAAALFAMRHGLVGWGELPIEARPADP